MTNGIFFGKTNRYLYRKVTETISKTSQEAAKLPAVMLDGDGPVTIRCGGTEEHWNSRYLAYHFYYCGAMCCEGSESSRYWSIVSGLLCGEAIPTDGEPVRTSA